MRIINYSNEEQLMTLSFTELAPCGFEITGASGHQLVDRPAADDCRAALDEHGVVIYPLEDAPEAFRMAADTSAGAIRVVSLP
jgi:hypothetical protein